MFGSSEIPSRVFVAFQSTSIFSGDYGKSYFGFERRWTKKTSLTHSSEPHRTLTYMEPSIPPEADPYEINEETGMFSATVRNLIGRFRRATPQQDSTCHSTLIETSAQPHDIANSSQTDVQAFAATDIYIKHVDLRKDGASINSLSSIDASRVSSPCSYYQFAKVLGAVQTGEVFSAKKLVCYKLTSFFTHLRIQSRNFHG